MNQEILQQIDLLIKQLSDITIIGEFATVDNHLDVGEQSGIFFVRLNGATLFVGPSPEEAFSIFYNQISKIHEDESKGADPEFSTLREILISRNKNVEQNLEALGKSVLSKALSWLEFKNFSQPILQKEISDNLRIIEIENILQKQRVESSYFEGDNDEEEYSLFNDWVSEEPKDYPPVLTPHEIEETFGEDGVPESPEFITEPPKPNNVTHGSTMADDDVFYGKVLKKAEDVRLSAKGIILDTHGRVLTLKDAYSNYWDLPGGHLKDNETIEEGFRREVFEETGLLVTSCRQLFIKNLALGNPPTKRPVVFFIASVMGNIKLSEEHEDSAWMRTDNLHVINLGVFLPVILEALEEASIDIPQIEKQGGHELEVSDMGMPYDEQRPKVIEKHHEPSGYDMGEPDPEVDNVQISRHEYPESMPAPINRNKTVRAGLTKEHDPLQTAYTEAAKKYFESKGVGGFPVPSQSVMDGNQKYQHPTSSHIPYTPDAENYMKLDMGDGTFKVFPVNKTAYSEAGNPHEREKPYIESDHTASTSSDSRDIGVFGSGAVIDLPEDEAEKRGVVKEAAGGVGSAGEGSGSVGSVGPLTTGDTFTPTYGGPRKKQHSDFNSDLTLKQHDMDVVGTNEGIATLPTIDAYAEDRKRRNLVDKYTYEEEVRHKNEPRNSEPPIEQKPLGQGESNLWLSGEISPNTRLIVSEGMDGKPHAGKFDEATEQFTNLSADILNPFIKKSSDSMETLKDFAILSDNVLKKADLGSTLVVAGWGSYYVVDREGHRISLNGLRKALANFLSKPEYANMNIFHSGIQVGKILPEFKDNTGQIWKTEVRDEGLFVVCEFRTDLEVARRAMAEVLRGNLRGFSLAGNSNPETKQIFCEHGQCWEEIMDLEIYEITLCQVPMNQDSWITDIIQRPDQKSCPECYALPVRGGYDSSLRPR